VQEREYGSERGAPQERDYGSERGILQEREGEVEGK
jgi:hypothetical protein